MARKTWRQDDLVWHYETDLENNEHDSEAGSTEHTGASPISVGAFLLEKGISHSMLTELFHEKLILVDGHKSVFKTPLYGSGEIRLQLPKEKIDHEPADMELHILYEDDDLLILDKPIGVTVNSKGQLSLANGIAGYFKAQGIKRRVRFLNRLDRDTSGCIVIAKSAIAQGFYQKQLESNEMEKWYTARVTGRLEVRKGIDGTMVERKEGEARGAGTEIDFIVLDLPMKKDPASPRYMVSDDGKMTRTAYRVLEAGDEESLVEVRLYTGKTHQIRVAFAHMGHPLVGDVLYGGQQPEGTKRYDLRAERLRFRHMRTGEWIEVRA